VTDFLAQKRKEIEDRLRELKPLIEEHHQLEAAAAALAAVPARAAGAIRRGPGRPRKSAAAGRKSTKGRRGRPRGSGTRAIQALEMVKAQPGITIRELADKMGINQNYLYRVLPALEADGKVVKRGKGWHPKG